jgi:hypothetical protein
MPIAGMDCSGDRAASAQFDQASTVGHCPLLGEKIMAKLLFSTRTEDTMSEHRFHRLMRVILLISALVGVWLVYGQSWAAATPVTVENPADIAKAEGIQTPITLTFSCTIPAGFSTCAALSERYTVPANKRLVLESVSYQLVSPPYYPPIAPRDVEIEVNYYGTYFLPLPPHLDTDPVSQTLVFRAYAKAGDIIYAYFAATAGRPINCSITISGQLINVP